MEQGSKAGKYTRISSSNTVESKFKASETSGGGWSSQPPPPNFSRSKHHFSLIYILKKMKYHEVAPPPSNFWGEYLLEFEMKIRKFKSDIEDWRYRYPYPPPLPPHTHMSWFGEFAFFSVLLVKIFDDRSSPLPFNLLPTPLESDVLGLLNKVRILFTCGKSFACKPKFLYFIEIINMKCNFDAL